MLIKFRMPPGIFSNLPQIALTSIGSFLLVPSLLRGFGHVDFAPGLAQMAAAYLVLVSTVGITFTLQATYSETRALDLGARRAGRDVALHPALVQ